MSDDILLPCGICVFGKESDRIPFGIDRGVECCCVMHAVVRSVRVGFDEGIAPLRLGNSDAGKWKGTTHIHTFAWHCVLLSDGNGLRVSNDRWKLWHSSELNINTNMFMNFTHIRTSDMYEKYCVCIASGDGAARVHAANHRELFGPRWWGTWMWSLNLNCTYFRPEFIDEATKNRTKQVRQSGLDRNPTGAMCNNKPQSRLVSVLVPCHLTRNQLTRVRRRISSWAHVEMFTSIIYVSQQLSNVLKAHFSRVHASMMWWRRKKGAKDHARHFWCCLVVCLYHEDPSNADTIDLRSAAISVSTRTTAFSERVKWRQTTSQSTRMMMMMMTLAGWVDERVFWYVSTCQCQNTALLCVVSLNVCDATTSRRQRSEFVCTVQINPNVFSNIMFHLSNLTMFLSWCSSEMRRSNAADFTFRDAIFEFAFRAGQERNDKLYGVAR